MLFDSVKLNPARAIGESFAGYRSRRAAANKLVELHLRGRVLWDSSRRGTMFYNAEQRARFELAQRRRRLAKAGAA
jgi:hypothetical protein